ncbi:MAG: adenylate/guanylate cyclase domain-containing protein [Gallionellaceae bacterium]
MKNTIGSKVFTIAIGLVALMTAVTFISAYNLIRVNGQTSLVSNYYLPLDQYMGEVRAYGFNEVIQFDHLPKAKQSLPHEQYATQAQQLIKDVQSCDLASHNALMDKVRDSFTLKSQRQRLIFELMGLCGGLKLESAAHLIERGLAEPQIKNDPEQNMKFAQLQQKIADIADARKFLHETLLIYFREINSGSKRSIEVVLQQIERDWLFLSKQINEVTITRLHKYSLEAAAKSSEFERQAIVLSLVITVVASILGLLFAALLTRNLVKPVGELLLGIKAIEEGDLDIQINVSSVSEITTLANSFNHMAVELKQKEVITETFGKYVDPRIVKGLIEDQQFSQNGEKRAMTVFFSDLEGFTSMTERLSAESVVKLLNQYFTVMSESVRQSNGIIDKYIGDSIMAFWGPPFTSASEHPKLACLAAIAQMKLLNQFEADLPDLLGFKVGLPKLNMRIGISTGEVIVGSIGSAVAKSYTVIGDNVNLASRLESANKNYGSNILICEGVWELVKDTIECREIDCICVYGKTQSIRVFEVMGEVGTLDASMLELKKCFTEGLAAYRACKWDEAVQEFEKCIELNPQEKASATFLTRIELFKLNPPSSDWDGVWNYAEK